MPAFAANLTMHYNELPFLDRFAAAAEDDFRGVEYLFPYAFEAVEIRNRLDAHGLTQVLFNAPPGNWEAGERGLASLPGREEEFRRSLDIAFDYAHVIGTRRLHVMAGLCIDPQARSRQRDVYLRNLEHAATMARSAGIHILLEPINTRDMPGYFLNHQEDGAAICREVDAQTLRLQFDLYHAQIMQGDVSTRLRSLLPVVGHVQVAGVPMRHEPDEGELNCGYVFDELDAAGYAGWVGCEYWPRTSTRKGLHWIAPWKGRSAG
ncbi:MAG: 2-oxo-tetronate isomerase [Gluconacetobacter sp.]|uniref:Hydroxypyruvate isomerase family protein n=1 Tax=Gluconacetobacter dulcium TaxID=2729096 RepID=A0A7W4JZI9_9PROT|nr:2-oxo-tetronate isomerase [Gluconacetobacter dulcium]MBB2197607.1 hydroxypyruvate isomerase family protein [Gluconacetobacter dulcium]